MNKNVYLHLNLNFFGLILINKANNLLITFIIYEIIFYYKINNFNTL